VIVYRESRKAGEADEEVRMSAGIVFNVAEKTETKKLKGSGVEAVLFIIGGAQEPDWFWMPKTEFEKSTEPHDINSQTSTPHQL
jgi:hypothetical protein